MVCAVMSGAIFKTKSLTIVPALCIPHRETGAGKAGGGHGWMAARVRRDVTKAEKAAALAPVSAGAHTMKYNLVAFLLKRCYNTVKLL